MSPSQTEKKQLNFLKDHVKKDFDILKKWIPIENPSYQEVMDNIHALLTTYIAKWIDDDYSRLLEVLYRTDIDEKKVRACFHEDKTSREIAGQIATLYIDRMIQKWNTRQEYSDDSPGDEWLDV